jgi:tripartite-type tricarboxylate transporter receptor subunit TctC
MQFAFTTTQIALPHVEAGRLRMLGIGSAKRFPRLPNLPTIAESGVKGYEAEQWYGVIAPRGTPAPIINKLSGELRNIIANADFQERLLSQGIAPVSSTPEAFAATIKQTIARFAKVIKELGLKVE